MKKHDIPTIGEWHMCYSLNKITVVAVLLILLSSSILFAQRVTPINMKGTKLSTGTQVTEAATAPTTPAPIHGDLWFDTTTNTLKVYDGTTWQTVSSTDPNDLKDDQSLSVGIGAPNTSTIDIDNGTGITLTAGTGITLSETGNNNITITGVSGSDDQNLSVGAGTASTSIIQMEDGTDISLVAGTGITLAETGSSITITGESGSDDQNLSVGAGTASTSIIQMEDGNDISLVAGTGITLAETGSSITITGESGSDDQNITGLSLSPTGILTIGIEDGLSSTVDLSGLNNSGTDNQNLSVAAGTATTSLIQIESGTGIILEGAPDITLTESGSTINMGVNEANLTGIPTTAITSGTNGQVLTTDASGNTVWQNPAAGADGDAWGVTGEDQTADVSRTGKVTVNNDVVVGGASYNDAAFSSTGTTIDFSEANLAYTTASAGAFTLTNLKDGGAYTLAVQGATAGVSTFTATGYTFKSKSLNSSTLANTHSVYSFLVMGNTVYYTLVTGL